MIEEDIRFHQIRYEKKAWIHAIKRGETRFQSWTPSRFAVVCRAHFNSDDYLTETQHVKYELS